MHVRLRKWFVAGLVLLGTLGLVSVRPAAAAGGPVSRVWNTPGASSPPGAPVVALTFDDGPDPKWTPQVLAVLRRYRVPATFFVVGKNVAGNRQLVRNEAAAGHSVQNHTWSHAYLTRLPAGGYSHQIDDTTRAIEGQTGAPVRCARPPYGALNAAALNQLGARQLTTVTWSVDPSDYRRPGAGVIAQRVVASTRAGGIILLHDGGGNRAQTVAALPAIIEGLRARGLGFASLC